MVISGNQTLGAPGIRRANLGPSWAKEPEPPVAQDSVALSDISSPAPSAAVDPFRRALQVAAPVAFWALPSAVGARYGAAGVVATSLASGVLGYWASANEKNNYKPSLDLANGVLAAVVGGGLADLGAKFGLTAVAGVAGAAAVAALSSMADS